MRDIDKIFKIKVIYISLLFINKTNLKFFKEDWKAF